MKNLKEDQVDCKFEERRLYVTFPGVTFQSDSDTSFDVTLADAIVPQHCKVALRPLSVVIALKKARIADWESLEKRDKDAEKEKGENSGGGKGNKKSAADAEKGGRKEQFDVEEVMKKIEGTQPEKEKDVKRKGGKIQAAASPIASNETMAKPTVSEVNLSATPSGEGSSILTSDNASARDQQPAIREENVPPQAEVKDSRVEISQVPLSDNIVDQNVSAHGVSSASSVKMSMPGAWPDSASSGTSRSASDHGRQDDDSEQPATDTDRSLPSPGENNNAELFHKGVSALERPYESSSLVGIASLFGSAVGSVVRGGKREGMPRGLYNMGQTCYVNSIVQALSSTPELRDYFLSSDSWKDHVNAGNPLGHSGKVAQSFATLMRQLNSSSSAVTPHTLINTLEKAWALFEDVFQQHDAQEVMAFLLDAIHEDLNERGGKLKGQMKEMADYDGTTADSIVSREFWDHHKLLNSSIIVENFQGLYKSSVTCKDCNKTSMKFDPFMYLTVPLPEERLRFNIYMVDLEGRRRLRKRVFVRKEGRVVEIKEKVKALMSRYSENNSKMQKLEREWLITETDPNGNLIQRTYDKSQRVRALADLEDLVAYEIEHGPQNSYIVTQHHSPDGPLSNRVEVFGTPLILSFVAGEYTQAEIYRLMVGKLMEHNVLPRDFDLKTFPPPFVVRKIETASTRSYETSPNSSDEECDRVPDRRKLEEEQVSGNGPKRVALHTKRFLRLYLDWRWEGRSKFYRGKQDQIFAPIAETDSEDSDSETVPGRSNGFASASQNGYALSQNGGSAPVPTLLDCIDLFTSEEELAGAEAVECSRCAKKTNAVKRFTLYGLPKILIIHLKRFRWDALPNGMSFSRKIETMIHFPIEADFAGLAPELMGEGKSSKYRLFAVVNHFGNNHSGHYTAFCDRAPEGSSESRWFEFDDEAVKEVHEDAVKVGHFKSIGYTQTADVYISNKKKTRWAYCLFYRRL
ncbi:cysteine proteinase [Gonapodya prolifera JEL478]|uniref:Ubiquitin carboxyl-terminal hydrolase n=1 Tax=Gonapodya prolifera (strain JEL478) TaxID=1344416 RepID=A0A138ZXU9_GONPJ|nr:cysteine proteinase [Gonapodya prolifera JEL478]|eukprot:KXS09299.1 cysteine proteinase [Gonapodya prolifera JEL478]